VSLTAERLPIRLTYIYRTSKRLPAPLLHCLLLLIMVRFLLYVSIFSLIFSYT